MGKQWKKVTDFILGGSKITADFDCSHEIMSPYQAHSNPGTTALHSQEAANPLCTHARLVESIVCAFYDHGQNGITKAPSLVLPFSSCVTLGLWPNISEPQLPQL